MILQGSTVVLAEDDPESRATTAAMLGLLGARVHPAGNGAEALERLASTAEQPALVVCDLDMPRMDGFELATEIRARPQLARVGLVALTAAEGPEVAQRTWSVGFDIHIVKPVTFSALELIVRLLAPPAADPTCLACSEPIRPADRLLSQAGHQMHLLCATRATFLTALEQCDRAEQARQATRSVVRAAREQRRSATETRRHWAARRAAGGEPAGEPAAPPPA
ncbi:MAG TPA: response regulator [Methylomirabilota bacterium]|nr:response regulator [Methylomirabilota bacterium]